MDISTIISQFKSYLWNGPLLLLLIATGFFLTYRLQGLQFRKLKLSLSTLMTNSRAQDGQHGDLSSFAALMTALAGAIGTGNITGIAIAVTTGGVGAIFWMWVIALFGMVTAYAESLLAIRFRETNARGQKSGGPMYTLKNALNLKGLAIAFSIFGVIASFGIGSTVQANSVASGLLEAFAIPSWATGLLFASITGMVIVGGISSIGRVTSIMVPFMALAYIGIGLIVCLHHWQNIPQALMLICQSAFTGQAATGGFLGSTIWLAIEQGVANGIFANEAGLGSLSIAAASADVKEPGKQGLLGIAGVFIATMCVCTITGLVLTVTGVIGSVDSAGQMITGSALTMHAFQSTHASFGYVVVIGLVLFAFTTTLAWAYYGEKCLEFLLGKPPSRLYPIIYIASIPLGAVIKAQMVWDLANIANGLMALPNLIGIFLLVGVIRVETNKYFAR